MRWISLALLLPLVVVLAAAAVTAQLTNPIAQYAMKSGVRGYSCSVWGGMASAERTAFMMGVVALSDALEHASLDPNHSLTSADYRAIELARSASDYAAMASAGCLTVPSSTPVLAVLYTVK